MNKREYIEELRLLGEEVQQLEENNCPTNPSKWSYYKSQAKKKFDVYPSAYANGWASKQYKAAGGGWKSCKKESIDEKMVTPQRGHNYYKLTKDTPIKYVSGRSGIGLKVPGVLLHNEYDTIKGKKGAYIIDYFGAHFYVDMKNKFASAIAHPQNRKQNKDLMKNVERVFSAPEHSDWKKYMNESKSVVPKVVGRDTGVKLNIKSIKKHLERNGYKVDYAKGSSMVNPKQIDAFNPKSGNSITIARNGELFGDGNWGAEVKSEKEFIKALKQYEKELGESVNESDVRKKINRRGDVDGLIVTHNGNEYEIVYSGDFSMSSAVQPYGIVMPGDDVVSFLGKDKKAKSIWKQLKPKVDKFVKSNESVNEVKASDISHGDFIHLKSKNKSGMVVGVSKDKVTIRTMKGIVTGKLSDVKLLHQDDVNEATSRTAMEIGGLTGMNKDTIQKFVDDNNLDIEKVYQFVKKGKLADRMKLVSAIAGKPNNPVQKKMVKQFSESLIKEAKMKLGNDSVNFKVMGDRNGLTLIAASGNDLDGLQDAIANDVDVKGELRTTLEKQLKVPVEIDNGYSGAGFRFNIDFYSLAKKVK